MVLEAGGPRETLLALGTVELLPEVDLLVLPQAARLVEAPLAHRAVVGPLSGVREPVSVHGPRVGEALSAVGAGEGFLSRVDLLVAFELSLLGELLAAQRALVGFLSRVNPHVYLKGGHLVTVSSTEPAAVGALGQMVGTLFLSRRVWWTVFITPRDMIRILRRHCGNKGGSLKRCHLVTLRTKK